MTTKVLKVGIVKTASKFCSRVRKESVSSIGRLPCLGVLLRPQRPRQVAKNSRGSRSDLLLSNPSPNLRNKNLGSLPTNYPSCSDVVEIEECSECHEVGAQDPRSKSLSHKP